MIINNSDQLAKIARELITDKFKEHLILITLDQNRQVICKYVIAVGKMFQVRYDPKKVFTRAILDSSASIALVHNHPTGNLEPSPADLEMATKAQTVCEALEMTLLDNLIVDSEDQHMSFRENELIKDEE